LRRRLELQPNSFVVELRSNDGYLLQHFLPLGQRVLGIEPAANVAEAARAKGVPTRVDFFDTNIARQVVAEHGNADLIIANNVLAQVPQLNDFIAGMTCLDGGRHNDRGSSSQAPDRGKPVRYHFTTSTFRTSRLSLWTDSPRPTDRCQSTLRCCRRMADLCAYISLAEAHSI
jgi:hypothetical protein